MQPEDGASQPGRMNSFSGMELISFVQLSLEALFRANSTQRLWRFMFGVAANLLIRLEG